MSTMTDAPATTTPITPDMASDITPELAATLLGYNDHNRPLNEGRVLQLANEMTRGGWAYNGRTIVLGENGRLLDGQHTLAAVVKSGVTIRALLAVGVGDAAQITMDTGSKRTFDNYLSMSGEKNAHALASAVRRVYSHEVSGAAVSAGVLGQGAGATIQQLRATLDRHPGVRESVSIIGTHHVLSQGMGGALHYLMSKVDAPAADEFFDSLRSGESLSKNNAIFALRERLIKAKQSRTARIPDKVQVAFVVKAFNAWRGGEPLSKFYYNPDKPFPQIGEW